MCCVWAAVLAGAGEWNALLVARKLDELAQLLLGKHLQGGPEELDVLVRLHQTHLVHGVSLRMAAQRVQYIYRQLSRQSRRFPSLIYLFDPLVDIFPPFRPTVQETQLLLVS